MAADDEGVVMSDVARTGPSSSLSSSGDGAWRNKPMKRWSGDDVQCYVASLREMELEVSLPLFVNGALLIGLLKEGKDGEILTKRIPKRRTRHAFFNQLQAYYQANVRQQVRQSSVPPAELEQFEEKPMEEWSVEDVRRFVVSLWDRRLCKQLCVPEGVDGVMLIEYLKYGEDDEDLMKDIPETRTRHAFFNQLQACYQAQQGSV